MRCLTLADRLRQDGANVAFVCRDLPGHLSRLLEDNGYPVMLLPAGADAEVSDIFALDWQEDAAATLAALPTGRIYDWLIVDQYHLDRKWESRFRSHVRRIMVIDDLANRPHDCDVLWDSNLTDLPDDRYAVFTPAFCRMLVGLRYLLLRPAFYDLRRGLSARDGRICRILISFGGADEPGDTMKALEAVRRVSPQTAIDVVIGGANSRRGEIEAFAHELPAATVHFQTPDMAALMARADLAFGGGGVTMWERAFLGLPSIVVIQADNQTNSVEAAARRGLIRNAGISDDVTSENLAGHLTAAYENPDYIRSAGEAALRITAAAEDEGKSLVATLRESEHVAS